MDKVLANSYWQNHKNKKTYKVLLIATHSETREEMVIYQDESTLSFWARPLTLFLEKFSFVRNETFYTKE